MIFGHKKEICLSPFIMAEIHDSGNVFPCCPRYVDFYSFGNIYESTFEEIWNSDKAKTFRKKILKGDYSLCNRDICFGYIEDQYNESSKPPVCKHLRLSYDTTCNVACTTCRDKIMIADSEHNDKLLANIYPMLKNVESIQLFTSGDVFASKHGINLLQTITDDFPNIKLGIDTNGILLTENMYNKLNLAKKINCLMISIPGITKSTYDKIVKYGNFDKLMDNVKFLSTQKQMGNISEITIVMVIHKLNYQEMPLMAEFAQKYELNVFYTCYQPWQNTEMSKKYDELAVFKSDNPNYNDFIKVLSNPCFKNVNCHFEPFIKELVDKAEKI